MFTFSFFRNTKTGSLHLRFINNRRKAEMKLGLMATEEELNDALSAKPKPRNLNLANTLNGITRKLRDLQMDFVNLGLDADMDVKEIRSMALKRMNYADAAGVSEKEEAEEKGRYLKFCRERLKMKKAEGTRINYLQNIKKIEAFCRKSDNPLRKDPEKLTFDDIDFRWLTEFDLWMRECGLCANSRARQMSCIKAMINHAIDEELTEKYPFRRFKFKKEETRKRSMTVECLRKIFDYKGEEFQKIYVDMFKLSFMLCGINMKDLYELETMHDGRIEYRRAKTGKLYSIKVEPEAMEIIERWKGSRKVLCLSEKWTSQKIFLRAINVQLKRLGERRVLPGQGHKIEIKPLYPEISTYWARHSWATIARKLGISVDDIALALGHSSAHKITSIYINEDIEAVDKANRRVLDYVLYGKE